METISAATNKIGKELTWSKVLEMINEKGERLYWTFSLYWNRNTGEQGTLGTGTLGTGTLGTGTLVAMTERTEHHAVDKTSVMTYIEWFHSAACDLLSTVPELNS